MTDDELEDVPPVHGRIDRGDSWESPEEEHIRTQAMRAALVVHHDRRAQHFRELFETSGPLAPLLRRMSERERLEARAEHAEAAADEFGVLAEIGLAYLSQKECKRHAECCLPDGHRGTWDTRRPGWGERPHAGACVLDALQRRQNTVDREEAMQRARRLGGRSSALAAWLRKAKRQAVAR